MYVVRPTRVDEGFREEMRGLLELRRGESRFEGSRRSAAIFCNEMLGIRPYAWQVRVLHDVSRAVRGELDTKVFQGVTSRQIGKTKLLAVLAIWCCLFNHGGFGTGNNTVVGVFSMSKEQSFNVVNEVKLTLMEGDYHMREALPGSPKQFFSDLLLKGKGNNKSTVTFGLNDGTLHPALFRGAKAPCKIVSSAPTSSVLGSTLSLGFIDEAMEVSDEFYDSVFGMTLDKSGGVQVLTSTPYRQSGFFWELMKNYDEGDDYHRAYVFTKDALVGEPGSEVQRESIERRIEGMRSRGKGVEVRRQYYAEFLQGADQFFNEESVRDMFVSSYSASKEFGGVVDVGVDFGGSRSSHSVITVSSFDEESGRIRRVWHKRYGIREDLNLLEDLRRVGEVFDVNRFVPESCPQGDYVIRRMKQELGLNVKEFNPSRDKARKYEAFNTFLSQGRVMSYEDEDLLEEMLALEVDEGRTRTKIHAPQNYTDDLIDSFVMSCFYFLESGSDETEILELY